MKRIIAAASAAVLAASLFTGCSGGKQGGGSYSMQNFAYTVGENIVINSSSLIQYTFKEKHRSTIKIEVTDFGQQHVTAQCFGEFRHTNYAEKMYENISVSQEEQDGMAFFYLDGAEQLGSRSIQHRTVIVGCEGCILQIEASFPEDRTEQWQQELDTILGSLSFTGEMLDDQTYENAAVSMEIGRQWCTQYADDSSLFLERSMADSPCEALAGFELYLVQEDLTAQAAAQQAAQEMGGTVQSSEILGIAAQSVSTVTESDDHSIQETVYFFEANGQLCRVDLFFCEEDAGMEDALTALHMEIGG